MDKNKAEQPFEFTAENIKTINQLKEGRVVPAKTQLMNALGIPRLSFMRLTPVAFEVKKIFGTCPEF